MFIILKSGYFQLLALHKSDLQVYAARKRIQGIITVLNTFKSIKMSIYFTLLIKWRFQGYRSESGIVIALYGGSLEVTLRVPLRSVYELVLGK